MSIFDVLVKYLLTPASRNVEAGVTPNKPEQTAFHSQHLKTSLSSNARAPADYSDLITKVIPAWSSDCIVQSFLSCQECLAFLVFKFSKSVWGVNQIIVCLSGITLSTTLY